MFSPGYQANGHATEALEENVSIAAANSERAMPIMQTTGPHVMGSLREQRHVEQNIQVLEDASRQYDDVSSHQLANIDYNNSNDNINSNYSFSVEQPSNHSNGSNSNILSVNLTEGSTTNGFRHRTRRSIRRLNLDQHRRVCRIHKNLIRTNKYLRKTNSNLSYIRYLLRQQLEIARNSLANHHSGTFNGQI